MNYKLDSLSPELEKYRDRIEATIKPYIEIAIENNERSNWWQSKFGGLPYLPKGFEYPIYICSSLQFTKKYAPLPYNDDRFKIIVGEDLYNLIDDDDIIYEEYLQISSPSVHKVGGYFSSHFGLNTAIDQSNPQYEQDPYLLLQDPDILLLQMNTDDDMGICWALDGAAQFFIYESELQQLDFSDVYYYWGRES
jgi:uncharacterized protein YwqG